MRAIRVVPARADGPTNRVCTSTRTPAAEPKPENSATAEYVVGARLGASGWTHRYAQHCLASDLLRRRARAPAAGAGRGALPGLRSVAKEVFVVHEREPDARLLHPVEATGPVDATFEDAQVLGLLDPLEDLVGRVPGECVSKESLRAHRVALDRDRQRHEELDEVAVGEGMAKVDAVTGAAQLVLLHPRGRDRHDLAELTPAPLAERLTPALVVDGPDPLAQRRIEVSLGVLEIGWGRGGCRRRVR